MAVYTRPSDTEIRGFLAARGVDPEARVEGIPAGSVNTNLAVVEPAGRRLFLRVYEEQGAAGAVAEVAMLARLAARGVPTPPPLGEVGTLAGKPAVLFPWREGGMRCQASVTAEDTRRVGAALAKVHEAGAGEARGAGRFGPPELAARLDRIEREAAAELKAAVDVPALRRRLTATAARADELALRLPRGLVHGDLFRDNVLFAPDGSIAALLDFESAFTGVLLFDLMVTVLSWCYGDALDRELASALVAGYGSVRPLVAAERDTEALFVHASLAALRFTITRITDYAMRPGPDRVMKDWRRFAARLAAIEARRPEGLARVLFGGG